MSRLFSLSSVSPTVTSILKLCSVLCLSHLSLSYLALVKNTKTRFTTKCVCVIYQSLRKGLIQNSSYMLRLTAESCAEFHPNPSYEAVSMSRKSLQTHQGLILTSFSTQRLCGPNSHRGNDEGLSQCYSGF